MHGAARERHVATDSHGCSSAQIASLLGVGSVLTAVELGRESSPGAVEGEDPG